MQKKQYEKNAKITVKSLAHFMRTGHNMGANKKKQGTLTTTPIFCQQQNFTIYVENLLFKRRI